MDRFDVSYPDPDEPPKVPWASHMVVPAQDSYIDEDGIPRLEPPSGPSPFEASFAFDGPVNGPQSHYQRERDESNEGDGFSRPAINSGPILGIQGSLETRDPEFDPGSYSESPEEAEENLFSDGDDSDDSLYLNTSKAILDSPASRGRGRGQGRGRGRGRGAGDGRGRGSLKQQLAKIDEGLGLVDKSRGYGRSRGRGRPRKGNQGLRMPRSNTSRRKTEALPSLQFKQLHEEASRAYIEGDYDRAEDAISQAIEKNPEISTVHSLLAEILEAKGEIVRAPWVLFAGAHVRSRDAQAWLEAADGIREFMDRQKPEELQQLVVDEENKSVSLQTQCTNYLLLCYRKSLSLNRDCHTARKRRALLLRETGAPKRAFRDYKYLIEHGVNDFFRDTDTLRYIAQESLALLEPERAIPFYDAVMDTRNEPDNITEALEWDHISLLAEIYLMAVKPVEGMSKVKKFTRLLLGRGDEDFWDEYDQDDREFDLNDEPRRCEVPGHERHEENLEAYGVGVPIDLRVKMGILRLKQGQLEEAIQHFNWIRYDEDDLSVEEFSEFYLEAAGALHSAQCFSEAIDFYEPLRRIAFQLSKESLERLANCYDGTKRYDEAEELYLMQTEDDPGDLVAIEKLARMFSKAELPERAEPYLHRLSEERRKKLHSMDHHFGILPPVRRRKGAGSNTGDGQTGEESLQHADPNSLMNFMLKPINFGPTNEGFNSARRLRLPRANGVNMTLKQQLREINQEEVETVFQEMNLLQTQQKSEDWAALASKVIQLFRAQKVFYPYDKHQRFWGYTAEARAFSLKAKAEQELFEKEMKEGKINKATGSFDFSADKIPKEFCGVHFSYWLDTFLRYALLKACSGQQEEAFTTCQAAADANVFYHSQPALEKIHCVWAACAAACGDEEVMATISRQLMKDHQFVGDSYRLYSALNLVKKPPNHTYNASQSQKFFLRHIKAMDWALLSEEERAQRQEDLADRAAFSRVDPKSGEPILATEVSCELLMIYASMLYVGQSHNEALVYLLRLYAVRPDDPLVNILTGLSYLGAAFKRQSSNRQFQVMQGLAMIKRYHSIRMSSENLIDKQEAEFNMGRTYQAMGLTHLCISHYEKCLEMAEEIGKKEGVENFGVEAAFALQNIWAAHGQAEKAEKIAEEWLVL